MVPGVAQALRPRRPVSVRYPFTSALKTTQLAVDT